MSTNISAMQALAKLNKLQEQKSQINAPAQEGNNRPNSIFDGQKKANPEVTNIDKQIAVKQAELTQINEAEKKPINDKGPAFE